MVFTIRSYALHIHPVHYFVNDVSGIPLAALSVPIADGLCPGSIQQMDYAVVDLLIIAGGLCRCCCHHIIPDMIVTD